MTELYNFIFFIHYFYQQGNETFRNFAGNIINLNDRKFSFSMPF